MILHPKLNIKLAENVELTKLLAYFIQKVRQGNMTLAASLPEPMLYYVACGSVWV
jgi:hypothetical protein